MNGNFEVLTLGNINIDFESNDLDHTGTGQRHPIILLNLKATFAARGRGDGQILVTSFIITIGIRNPNMFRFVMSTF